MQNSFDSIESFRTIPPTGQAIGLALMVLVAMIVTSLIATLALQPEVFNSKNVQNLELKPQTIAISVLFSILVSYGLLVTLSKNYWQQHFKTALGTNLKWLLVCISTAVAFALLVLAAQHFFLPPENIQLTIEQAYKGNWLSKGIILIVAILLAPIFEEYLFRGLIFDSLNKHHGKLIAILVSSFIFTLFHLFEYYQYWVAWFAVFCLALMLAIIRYKSQSILNPIVLHAGYNATLMIAGTI